MQERPLGRRAQCWPAAGAPDGVEAAATAVRSIALEDFVLDHVHLRERLFIRIVVFRIRGRVRVVQEIERVVISERFSGAKTCVHFNDFGNYAHRQFKLKS